MLLSKARVGLDTTGAAKVYCDRALHHLKRWLEEERYLVFHPQLASLIEHQRWELLLDSFYQVLPFGTGGRRGPVGFGPNRFNHDSVTASVQGHVDYLRRRFPTEPLRVVVAYDVRVFTELRGLYERAVPNPMLGMSSRDFARLACGVYAANGVVTFTVPGGDGFLLSTPGLSFAIRHLQAHAGLNISASHNHPDDNGLKFYLASGGQPTPPEDEVLARAVEAASIVHPQDFDEACAAGLVKWLDSSVHAAYLESNLACSIDSRARAARLVYSPLNGTGKSTVGELLPRAGFDVHIVKSQWSADGSFAAVKFRIPNPEVAEAMEAATSLAREVAADAALATDPDADRLGAVVPRGDEWIFLNGNQLAVLLLAFILETKAEQGALPAHGFVLKTAVTTELLTRIARFHDVHIVGDLLVGFKYIGAALDEIERNGCFRDHHLTMADFLFAAEESNGFLVNPELRDKDASGAALLLGELAARLRSQGRQLGAHLDDLYRRYGYAAGVGYSIVADGITGRERVDRMMAGLRQHPPRVVSGHTLQELTDHWDEVRCGKMLSQTDRSSRNFLQLRYDKDLSIAVRPSGTEPKIKLYVERLFDPQASWAGAGFNDARERMDAATHTILLELTQQLLAFVDIHLPPAALLLSSLVSLDARIDFAERFLPEMESKLAERPSAIAAWLDVRLKGYGQDPRHLVQPGIAEYLRTASLSDGEAKLIRELFFLA